MSEATYCPACRDGVKHRWCQRVRVAVVEPFLRLGDDLARWCDERRKR